MVETVSGLRQRLQVGFRGFVSCIGWILMMTDNSGAAPAFNLKPATEYFSDARTLGLLNSALKSDLERAKKLVAEGANPNDDGPKDDPGNRLRLLHYGIASSNAMAVKVLMAVGADPEMNTSGGAGPGLLFAITLDKTEMLSVMLDMRPIASLAATTVKTLLFRSVALSRPRCLEVLLKHGAPIDFPDGAGYTVMMRALDAQDYDLAEWLLLQGASVNILAGGDLSPAYSLQFDLAKFKSGTATHNKLQRLKQLMEARGAKFPAPSPKEIRASKGQ